jgi:DNA-binding NarL/FixJ family response regulator
VPQRCLIIDDSEGFLASAARLLESQGARVVGLARSRAEALELADTQAPDLVLVDVELGEEDGVALAHELVAQSPSTRAILISAHELDDLDFSSGDSEIGFLPKASLSLTAIERLLPPSRTDP